MALTPDGFEIFAAEVIGAKSPGHAGHQVGETLCLNRMDSGGRCGFFRHDRLPALSVMRLGIKYPWAAKDELRVRCPDSAVDLTLLTRRRANRRGPGAMASRGLARRLAPRL